jgi:hypothetical protein
LNVLKIFDMSTKFTQFPHFMQYLWIKLCHFAPQLRNPEFVFSPHLLGVRFTLQLGFTKKIASFVLKLIEALVPKFVVNMTVYDVLAVVTLVVQMFYGMDDTKFNLSSALNDSDLLSVEEWEFVKPEENQICERIFQEFAVGGMSDPEIEAFLLNASGIISGRTGDMSASDFSNLASEIESLYKKSYVSKPSIIEVNAPSSFNLEESSRPPWERVKIYSAAEATSLPLNAQMEKFLGLVCSLTGTDLSISRSKILTNVGKFCRLINQKL